MILANPNRKRNADQAELTARQLVFELRAEVANLRIDLDVITADRRWLVATVADLAIDMHRLMEGDAA